MTDIVPTLKAITLYSSGQSLVEAEIQQACESAVLPDGIVRESLVVNGTTTKALFQPRKAFHLQNWIGQEVLLNVDKLAMTGKLLEITPRGEPVIDLANMGPTVFSSWSSITSKGKTGQTQPPRLLLAPSPSTRLTYLLDGIASRCSYLLFLPEDRRNPSASIYVKCTLHVDNKTSLSLDRVPLTLMIGDVERMEDASEEAEYAPRSRSMAAMEMAPRSSSSSRSRPSDEKFQFEYSELGVDGGLTVNANESTNQVIMEFDLPQRYYYECELVEMTKERPAQWGVSILRRSGVLPPGSMVLYQKMKAGTFRSPLSFVGSTRLYRVQLPGVEYRLPIGSSNQLSYLCTVTHSGSRDSRNVTSATEVTTITTLKVQLRAGAGLNENMPIRMVYDSYELRDAKVKVLSQECVGMECATAVHSTSGVQLIARQLDPSSVATVTMVISVTRARMNL